MGHYFLDTQYKANYVCIESFPIFVVKMDMSFWTTESHMLNYRRILMHGEWSGLPLKYWAPTYGELNLYLRSTYGQNSKYTYVLPTASSIYTYVLPTPHQNKLKSPINPMFSSKNACTVCPSSLDQVL